MGEYTIPGYLSRQNYTFKIAGDQPSQSELQKMQAILQRDEQAFAQQFEQQYGLGVAQEEDPGSALGRGLQRGIPQFQSALGSAAGAIGLESVEDYLQRAATERQLGMLAEDPGLLEGADFRDVRGLGSGLSYVGELLGEQLPLIGGTVAGTAAGVAAGASLPVSAALATVAVSYPQLFGSNIQRQEGQVAAGELADVDVGRAALTAVGQTALEAVSNIFLAGRVPGGVIRSILENAPVEALTELGQQALERQQAGLSLDSEDAYREYLDAAVAGGVLGGVFGGVSGLRGGREELPPAPAPTPTPTPTPAPTPAPAGALPDPTAPITTGVLDQLGVPKGHPVYKRFQSGQYQTREEALNALDEVADTVRNARVEGDVRTYVEQVRAVDTAQPGLGGLELEPAGAGVPRADLPGEPDAGGAAAPDAGRVDVSGERAGDAAGTAPTQPTALTDEEAFVELAEQAEARRAAEGRTFSGPISDAEYRNLSPADKLRYVDEVGMPPAPAAPAAPAAPGVQVRGVDEAVANGVGTITVTEDGAPVPFKNFALSVDGNRAEVGMVERAQGARRGIGRDSYVALGETLAARGITLQSSELLQGPGKALWERLAAEGKARRNPQTKRFEFVAAPRAPRPDVQPATELRGDVVPEGGLSLLHGSPRSDLTINDIEIVREGQKQSKPGRKLGGLYATAVGDAAQARGYANMAGPEGTVYEVGVKPGTKVLRKDGDITRLSESDINRWVSEGYGLVVGRDPRGRTEYVVIDKSAIVGIAPSPEPEFVPGFDQEPEGTPDVRGVDPFADLDVQDQKDITPEQIESRVAAAPEPEPAPEPAPTPTPATPATEQMARNVIPGRTTGTAGQVIPEGIAPVPGREPEPSPTRAPDVETAAALNAARMTKAQADRAADAQVAAEIRRKFTQTSPALQTYVREEVDLDPDRDVTSAEDKQKILALLNKAFTKREKSATNPEWAAHEYFRKHPDVLTALDTISYDAIAAPTQFAKVTEDMSEGAKEYYRNTGRVWGTSAGKWILGNMSREARLQMFERLDFYRPQANDAVQRAVADSRDAAVKRDRAYREYMGDQTGEYIGVTPDTETAAELGFGTEDLPDIAALFSPTAALDMPMHPQVVAAIRRGDINAALDGIIATAGSPEASKLAAKLRPFVQNIQLAILEPSRMEDLNAVFGDGTRNAAAGVYIYAYPEAEMQAAEPYAPERIALRRELSETVALNSETGLTPSTFLHELIHVATISTLENKAHPLTRQIVKMLQELRKILPDGTNGILNQYEFVSDGMTDPGFMEKLAQIDTNNVSFLQRLHHSLRNFLRQLVGLPPRKPESMKTSLDNMFDNLLAPSTPTRDRGEIYLASRRVATARAALNSMAQRVTEFKPENVQDMRRIARLAGRQIPFRTEVKDFIIRASMPLPFVAEAARRYLPTASMVADLVREHGAQQHRMSQRVDETMLPIQDWAKKSPDKIAEFDRIRFTATEIRMDPRKDRAEYDQFEMSYNILDADGDVARTVTKRYRTREARNDAVNRHNAAGPQGQTRAKGSYDPETDENKERLRRFDEIKAAYRQLGPEGQKAMNLAFELPEYFRNEMKRVVQIRLDAMLPGQRTMQERVYKKVFEKIFAEALINPYQALQRRGNFGLSYVGRDPSTQDTDADGKVIPGTGDIKVFKHAFETARQRDTAANLLRQLGPEAEIEQIKFYELDKPSATRERPSLEFAVALLNKLDEKGGQLGDPAVRENVLNLVFDASPEASFLNSYKQRKDVPGYIGDITPLGIESTIGDTMNNIRANGMSLAARIADMEFRSRLAAARNAMDTELATFEDRNRLEPFDKQAGNSEEARVYHRILTDFTRAPFNERANWSRNLTAGGYALTLGFNVSTAAITFFQMPTIIFPFLAGKYGSRSSMGALGVASRLLTSSGRERTIERVAPEGGLEQVRRKVGWYDFSVSNLDFTDPKNSYLQQLYDIAENAGVFNRSLTQEILDETGAKGWVQKTAAYSGLMQHHAERYVRESTLLATYLAELKERSPQARGMGMKQFVRQLQDGTITVPDDVGKAAADQAVYTSEMTNGSMLAASAPLLSQTNLGAVVYLFKRFPLSMMNMLWHTAKRAASGTNDPADRKIAALQFGGMVGSIGLFAGASGIPMFHTVAALWNLIKDEEDEDLETLIRTGVLGERGLTGLVNYYAGVDVASRIGLSGVFYRPGFNTEDQPPLATLLEGFGGPIVGLFNKYTDRVPFFFQEGEYWRMTEALMPTAMGNAMKSVRFYTEGVRTLRHDPLIDDIGEFGAGAQFFGFASAEYTRQLAENNYLRGVDNAINTKIQKLLRRRYMAYRMGDRTALRDVMQDIAEFNRRYPSAAIDADTMARSLQSHQDTTSRMHHGITFSKKNEDLLARLAGDFSNATAYSR